MRKDFLYSTTVIFFLTLVSACSSPNITLPQAAEGVAFEFTDCDEFIDSIATALDEESRNTLLNTVFEDIIKFHHSWGSGIRNSSGLWKGNNTLNKSCARLRDKEEVMHPDDVAMIIMEEVWKKIRT